MEALSNILKERPVQRPTPTKAMSNFEEWVDKTAKLLGRSYIQTFKLVEHWPEHKIERRYKEAINCGPDITPAIKWWWLRKKEKTAS